MKHTYSIHIRLDEETRNLVTYSAKTLGISMNELISSLLYLHLPLDVDDLVYYHYEKARGKGSVNYDNRRA